MKNTLIYLLLILLLFNIKAQAQTALTDYLTIGAQNNPGLKAKFSAYNAALERVPQVGTLPDMQVAFGYFITPIETRVGPQQAKISVSQLLPWFGTLSTKEDVAIQTAKAKYEAFEESKSKLFFEIKSTYYSSYFIEQGIAVTEENIRILNTFLQLAIIKVETGKASVVDEMRVEMELNELKNKLAYLTDRKETSAIEFNKLLNDSIQYTLTFPAVLQDNKFSLSKTELLDTITNNNHLIKQIDYKILAWQNKERAGRKVGSPKIAVGLDYFFIGESESLNLPSGSGQDAIMAKVGISIPLYRKKYNAIINEAVLEIEANEYQKENKENELTVLFEKGYNDYQDAERRINLYERQIKLANQSLNILLTAYSTDGRNFEEVLRMERKTLAYALAYDKAKADKNVAVAFITYLTGQ